jgi:hypothetical protein
MSTPPSVGPEDTTFRQKLIVIDQVFQFNRVKIIKALLRVNEDLLRFGRIVLPVRVRGRRGRQSTEEAPEHEEVVTQFRYWSTAEMSSTNL